jgi:alkane 1-monooxygenase
MFKDLMWPYFTLSALVLLDIYLNEAFQKPLLVVWVAYGLLPIIDALVPEDTHNPTLEEQAQLKLQAKWKVPVLTYLMCDWIYFLWMLKSITSGELSFLHSLYVLIVAGNISGVGLVAAHEIFHKKDPVQRVIGTLHMSKSFLMHFFIEHLYGHHKNVATPLDPASASKGESLYHFIPKSVIGSFLSSWNYEVNRVGAVWTLQNRHLWFFAIQGALTAAIWYVFGLVGLGLLFAEAACAVCMLEATNYIEHYGLERKEISPGVYEPVNLKHSWNAPQVMQNVVLFKIQRHSDHHENSLKPYQTLCSYEESPKLPCGYAVGIIAAAFPPVWYSMIDPLVIQANNKGVVTEEALKQSGFVLKSFVLLQSMLVTTLIVLA